MGHLLLISMILASLGLASPAVSAAESTQEIPDNGIQRSHEVEAAAPRSPAQPRGVCLGDCDGNLAVTVDELVTLVAIALGELPPSRCEPGDADRDGRITVDEIVTSVQRALSGCAPPTPAATSTATWTPTPSQAATRTRSATPTSPPSTPTATATATDTPSSDQRIVSDLLLGRRWPNAVIPYKFAPPPTRTPLTAADLQDREAKIARVLAAMNGSTTIAGCTARSCVGWGEAGVLRFVECPAGKDHCGEFPYYAYIIVGPTNSTKEKRGFSDLRSATIDLRECPNGLEDTLNGKRCRDRLCNWNSDDACVFDIWVRPEGSFMWNVVHEFGHLLGFQHEQFRPDRDGYIDTTACARVPEWTNDKNLLSRDEFIGAYDVRSAMHYVDDFDPTHPTVATCFTSKPEAPIGGFRNDDMPTSRDLAKLQLLCGARADWLLDGDWCIHGGREVHPGDFDGDGHDDLLCHSAIAGFAATGRRWLDYSNDSGQFNGTNWSSGTDQYCWGSSRHLYVGDFDGDGDDDNLCHNSGLGTLSIDYTNALGELNGQDWPDSGTQPWDCVGSASRAYVGDFNGDGRDDLLCHDQGSGIRWIDWADESGHFFGPDWTSESVGTRSWCTTATERILIGDFNRDGRDDALCHDTWTGHRKIDYASVDGDLKGTNWSSEDADANAFCWRADQTLFVADIDGDGADDLLCHDARIGSVSADLADPQAGSAAGSGLRGSDWLAQLSFCNAQDAQLVVGSFDRGNSRTDLLCHNRTTGHKAVLYAHADGTFRIPPGF